MSLQLRLSNRLVSSVAGAVLACALAAAGARPASANNKDKAASGLKSHEYETERAGIKIALWEKYNAAEEKNWKQNGKVILLVHGATWSSRCTFDPVEGYSLMDTLADQGYDVWAMDLHGYGRSGRSRDWTQATSAAEDIDAAADYIRALRWVEKVSVLGYQWGTTPVGLFATKHPNKVHKLVLFGLRYGAADKVTQPEQQYRLNSQNAAMLKPEDGDLDADFVRMRAQVCFQNDPKSPNGPLIDMAQASPVEPAKLRAPTLMIMGEKDADPGTLQDRLEFFKGLGSRTRVFTVISGLGKYATFEKNRGRFETALVNFLDLP